MDSRSDISLILKLRRIRAFHGDFCLVQAPEYTWQKILRKEAGRGNLTNLTVITEDRHEHQQK
jgi:hypothetical protein